MRKPKSGTDGEVFSCVVDRDEVVVIRRRSAKHRRRSGESAKLRVKCTRICFAAEADKRHTSGGDDLIDHLRRRSYKPRSGKGSEGDVFMR